jgi:transposase
MVRSEVLPGPKRRRRWSAEEKARIVAELDTSGVRGSDVARRHGVSRSLLYAWVKERKQGSPAAAEIAFAPVVLTDPPSVATPPAALASAPVALTADRPAIEIETKMARVRLPVDTKPATVLAVIRALRARA